MISVFRNVLALVLVALLALAPAVAEARAGYSSGAPYSSLGSRGSRTYDPLAGAAPVQRSVTPSVPGSPSTGPAWTTPGRGPSGYGWSSGHSFWRGLAGGFFGAWLGSMLFGGSSYGYDGMGMHAGGFLGSFVMLLVLFWVGRLVWRSVMGFGPGFGPAFARGGAGRPMGFYQPVPRALQPALPLDERDFAAFGAVLTGVQAAWSRGDIDGLRRQVTPEMLSYFAGMLANNASQRVVNRVENVVLLHGDPLESWREGGVDYATCRLRWSALDYTHRLDRNPADRDFLVDGDPRRPVEVQECWTFRRTLGGAWLLSAIQQVG
jgi:predicted lipid-binding transport protein (Tim44 family)